MTLLADVNHPGSQEDVVSNWEPAHSLVEDAISGAEIAAAPSLLALAVTCPPLCLQRGGACTQPDSFSLVFTQSFFFLCEQARLHIRVFRRKVLSLPFFFSLWLSHSLGCYLRLAPSDCPQNIHAWSLP